MNGSEGDGMRAAMSSIVSCETFCRPRWNTLAVETRTLDFLAVWKKMLPMNTWKKILPINTLEKILPINTWEKILPINTKKYYQ